METALEIPNELVNEARERNLGLAKFKTTGKMYFVGRIVKAGEYGQMTVSKDYHYARSIRNFKPYGKALTVYPDNLEWIVEPPQNVPSV